ncbi:AMP-binding protein [Microtetraspora niveoalba]|uniref:AMP-binding protein n=1 Tax=Microtetraspora niveoalba TaxID=46175 RepID=UPI00082D0B60|nr:AMP-binding protein [Microtetraspora niveoalba]
MTDSIVNRIVGTPPAPGHHLRIARLGGGPTVELTEVYAAACRVAAGLRRLGLKPGDRIGILAANCLEWVLLDLAALRCGVVTAGFEPGKFAPDPALLDRYDLALLFTDRPEAAGPEAGTEAAGPDPRLRPIDEVNALAADTGAVPEPVGYPPDAITTIKFTSGSTGEPKGLGASVGSIDSSLRAVQQMFTHGPGDDIFVFLPLSLLQQRYWIYSALAYGHDVTLSSYEAAFATMRRVRPTVVMGVPGFFEAAKRHIESEAARGGLDLAEAGRRLFGDRIRYLWTGSAPASSAMLRFFTDNELPIYEGYGLNETCIVTKNHPGASREGSVGRVLPGKRVLIGPDGVVSIAADHPVNVRYEYAAPGETERVFGPGGLVRTGDLGYLDEDGYLFILGRADDVIVLDNGKKVIVRPIEERLRASPEIEQCVVFCPTQTHLVAVVSPARRPADAEAIAAHLAEANEVLAPDERIRGVVVAETPFSIGNGLLTSQYKPRRKEIFNTYRSEIMAIGEGVHVC